MTACCRATAFRRLWPSSFWQLPCMPRSASSISSAAASLCASARSLDEAISDRVYDAFVYLPLKAGNRGDGLQSLRNLDSLRSFLSGMGPIALFDLPWIPLYLIICFAFHTLIGLTALFGAIILCALTILTEVYTRDSSKQVMGLGVSRNNLADTSRRNAEALVAMGMTAAIGAALACRQTGNTSPASSKPVTSPAGLHQRQKCCGWCCNRPCSGWRLSRDQPTGNCRHHHCRFDLECARARTCRSRHRELEGFVAARQSWQRLNNFSPVPRKAADCSLPAAPCKSLTVENASVSPPGSARARVASDVNFMLESAVAALGDHRPEWLWQIESCAHAGRCLAAGARQNSSRWLHLTINGRPKPSAQHIGYLPQDVELLSGTIAENIARFATGTRNRKRSLLRPRPPAFMTSSSSMPEGYENADRRTGRSHSRPVRRNGSRLRARSTAIRFWLSSMNPTRILMPKAMKR